MNSMRDAVCGKSITETTARAALEYRGRRYLFCSRGCRTAFEREPGICLAGTGLEKAIDPEGIDRWVCQRKDELGEPDP